MHYVHTHASVHDNSPAMLVREHPFTLVNEDGYEWTDDPADWRKLPATVKFFHLLDTDGQYAVRANGDYLGEVHKVYTGRSSYLWTIQPVAYTETTRMRVAYRTRAQAAEALVDFHRSGQRKRSLVEG